jgi:hypothetical protein
LSGFALIFVLADRLTNESMKEKTKMMNKTFALILALVP